MSTYGATRDKFKARLNRRDCTDALADGFLQDSITRIQRLIRVPAGEKTALIPPDGTEFVPIPNDYLMMREFVITNGAGIRTILVRKPLQEVLNAVFNGAAGTSRIYARQGSLWVVGPKPVTTDIIQVDYYSEFATATQASDDNILLDIANDLVVQGALSYACDHWNDKRGPLFEGRFTQILSDVQQMADEDETSGATAMGQAFCYPSDYC